MKKIDSCLIIPLLIFLFIIEGCATSIFAVSGKEIIKIGMTKAEVLNSCGEPRHKVPPEEETSIAYNENRYEFWEYPSAGFFGHTTLVAFNKDGIVTDIETLYK